MKNIGVLAKSIKNPHADAINKMGYSIRVNYGNHTKVFNSIDEYEPSPGEIAALEEYNKRNSFKEKVLYSN